MSDSKMRDRVDAGRKAAETNKAKYGTNYYKRIGAIGGKLGHVGGFSDTRPWYKKLLNKKNPVAVAAGHKGGVLSKRRKHESN